MKRIANSLAQNVPSLEELDKIGEKIKGSFIQMVIEEREKERIKNERRIKYYKEEGLG